MTFFTETEDSILKYIWKHKRPWITKAIMSKMSNTFCITIEDLHISSHSLANWSSTKAHDGEDNIFNKCCWENWISTCKKLRLDPCLLPCTNVNSKWIKYLNIRHETLPQLQEVVGNTLEHTGIGNIFLNRTQKAQKSMRKNEWIGCIKLKSFCTTKEQSLDLRYCLQNERKSLPAIHPIRD
jgi:hypothetical protein